MSFEGMDVDQLQGLAKQIDSDAQALDSLVTTLTGVVGTITLLWNGPVAATFEQDWQSKNRPALLAAGKMRMRVLRHQRIPVRRRRDSIFALVQLRYLFGRSTALDDVQLLLVELGERRGGDAQRLGQDHVLHRAAEAYHVLGRVGPRGVLPAGVGLPLVG